MPIYEYHCKSCAHHFERLQKMNEAPTLICPKCNKSEVERLVSAAGFELKGTGWYATDFKNPVKPKPVQEAKSTESATTGSSSDAATPKSSETKKAE